MNQRTSLYESHQQCQAKIVDFHGWDMPLHYGSQVEEHHAVRQRAGMFDVSHMTVIDLSGSESQAYLRHVLANDVAKLSLSGKALYSCLLNETGGVIDDLIVYYFSNTDYRLVVNSSTRERDWAWLTAKATAFDVKLTLRTDLAIIAVQGPQALVICQQALPSMQAAAVAELTQPFFAKYAGDWMIARTGYTGEEGVEIVLPANEAEPCWQALLKAGVQPCGLGARDTLRLEAGMNLYGNDMDETTSPLESGLAWTLAFDDLTRGFIGRAALEKEMSQGLQKKLVGLVLREGGVLRAHQKVITPQGEGEITSGGFSPTLKMSIAFARIPISDEKTAQVSVRDKLLSAQIVKLPFVRKGKILI